MTTPSAVHAAVFAALVRQLKLHPALQGTQRVRTWSTPDDGIAGDDPNIKTKCPMLRLTPLALPETRHTRTTIARPLRVIVEAFIAGRDFAAAAELGERVARAVTRLDDPATRQLRAAVRAAGASDLVLEQMPQTAEPGGFEAAITKGQGSILIPIFIRTR